MMNFVDLVPSSRMSALIELTAKLRSCHSPYEALLTYNRYLRDAYMGRAHLILSTSGLNPGQYRVWRLMDDNGTERVEPQNPWRDISLPIYAGGIIAAVIKDGKPHLVRDTDWTADPHFADVLRPYRSMIAVPLINEGFPLNWSIMLSRDANYFTADHLEESATRGTLIASLLGSLHATKELARANAQIESELLRMARIQRALLPDPIPDIPGVRLATTYETFGQVGGDIYDFVQLSEDRYRWCIFLGDASGHGPSAAVVAAMVHATLHDCAGDASGPAQLCQVLNQRLCQKRIEGSFLTAFLGFYEPLQRSMSYALAGHPAPAMVSASDLKTDFLDAVGGLPLGIDDFAEFDELTINLNPSQSLLLYTDGITEARAPDGTMFGTDGISRSLCKKYVGGAQSLIDRLRESLVAHQQGRRPDDDQTAVAIHFEASGGE